MFWSLLKKNSIPKMARVMPSALIEGFDKKDLYSFDEIKNAYAYKFKYEHNIEYAYARLCSQLYFDEQANE